MLLTITTTHSPAADLGYLLHKHPDRLQSFDLSFGRAHVFYPEVSPERCTAALLLDVDAVGLTRGKMGEQSFLLGQYVNDRPYVASSFLSVALSQVFGSALNGHCKDRPELVQTPIPLEATLNVLPVRGGEAVLRQVFEPLGYEVTARGLELDERFPEWGASPYYSVTLRGVKTLSALLSHLYVLVPVFDNEKHYFVGKSELEKLLSKGAGWLESHPWREQIARRYLGFRPSLYREALARLRDETPPRVDDAAVETEDEPKIPVPSLNAQRHSAVCDQLKACGATSVLDVGCAEGQLLRQLSSDRQFRRLVGVDVSVRALQIASRRLRIDRLPERQAERIELLHGSLMYRDRRFSGFDAAAVVEVVEHFDPPRLSAFERVLFEFAQPRTIVLTTPNREYNVKWETLPADRLRHRDHRFEWTRAEFQNWATGVAVRHSYSVRFVDVGEADKQLGPPTQMAVFVRSDRAGNGLTEAGSATPGPDGIEVNLGKWLREDEESSG